MKDAYYFKHDSNARHDPKIKALISKYGVEGYGRFWIILELMRESSGYKIEDEEYVWDAIAEQMKCPVKDVLQFMNDCVDKFKLFVHDEKWYYSESFLERMNKLDEIRQKRKLAAYERWTQNND